MVYELRTYWAAPGKIEALHQRFRTLTLGVFKRHNMELVGFWTPQPVTPESGDLVYILRFADEAAKIAAWAAFQQDPEWVHGRDISEANGALVAHIDSVLMVPTDYAA